MLDSHLRVFKKFNCKKIKIFFELFYYFYTEFCKIEK